MKFWQAIAMVDMAQLPVLARRAEELGFEGVTLADHLVTFATQYQPYEYSKDNQILWHPETQWPDPWVQIAALAQVTSKLKFLTTIYVLPMRDPFSAAKAIATASRISNERVILGVGTGWQEAEFNLVGQAFRRRGRRTDEMLAVLELLMTGAMVEFHGHYYDFEPLQMSPGVRQRVPVMVGGYSPAAYQRAARHDGWVGGQNEVEELGPIIAALRHEREQLGRSAAEPFEIFVSLRHLDADTLKRAAALGVTRIFRSAWLDENGRASVMTLEQKLADMEAFAEHYLA